MAAVTPWLDLETFFCSACRNVLKDAVTRPCGHSHCMSCVTKSFLCPQCNICKFHVVVKDTVLAGLVEHLIEVKAIPAGHCNAGPEDVACDFCTGRKLKAVKSCLVCLASYCEKHLQPHHDVAPLKKHKLVDPSKEIQENICSRHGEVMKIFCRTDEQSICYLCLMDEHKGHDTVSAAAERTERQRELEASRLNIQQRIRDREDGLQLLRQEVTKLNQGLFHSERIFKQLISIILEKSLDAKKDIESQQKDEASRVKDLQEKLRQEISELKRSDAELQELSHTEDLNEFLQKYPSVSPLSEPTDSSSTNIRPTSCFKVMTAALSDIRDKLEDGLREKWANVFLTAAEVEVLLSQ